jgi:hypothetical protein
MDYWKADGVPALIDKYRKFHETLVGAKFACIFREKAQMSDGEPVVGKIRKVSDRYEPMLEESYDYIMEIGADVWQELSASKREAWVDHLLGHCYGEEDEQTGEMTWKTRRPEIVAFADVIDRHGVHWNDSLKQLKEVDLDKSLDPSSASSSESQSEGEDDSDSEEGDTANGTPVTDVDEDFDDMFDSV